VQLDLVVELVLGGDGIGQPHLEVLDELRVVDVGGLEGHGEPLEEPVGGGDGRHRTIDS
jgi:hypothetical protein